MGLVFYYLFHYLFSSSSPPRLSPGIEGKHKSAASLLCTLVYVTVVCGGGGGGPLRGGTCTVLRTHTRPLPGGFSCSSV